MIWEVAQRVIAGIALVATSPALIVLGLMVRRNSPGPVLHRATRVGVGGSFALVKLRTMRVGEETDGPAVTASGDPRITKIGRFLRRTKLDELPQLWNVLRGDMLLVGPRPEDPRYVDWSDQLHREVFGAKPGITGPTALAYRDEETILANAARRLAEADGRTEATDHDIDRAYREEILPAKLLIDAEYLRTRSAWGDLRIIGRTIGGALRRTGPG